MEQVTDLVTARHRVQGLYKIEYHTQYKDKIPIMSWYFGMKHAKWMNFTWQTVYVGFFNAQDKSMIRFTVGDFCGTCRTMEIPIKFIKSMQFIDDNVCDKWWLTKKYSPSYNNVAGYWSEEPMGQDEFCIVISDD